MLSGENYNLKRTFQFHCKSDSLHNFLCFFRGLSKESKIVALCYFDRDVLIMESDNGSVFSYEDFYSILLWNNSICKLKSQVSLSSTLMKKYSSKRHSNSL